VTRDLVALVFDDDIVTMESEMVERFAVEDHETELDKQFN
jgi:hypothetical protein